jgi:hypothetical protein
MHLQRALAREQQSTGQGLEGAKGSKGPGAWCQAAGALEAQAAILFSIIAMKHATAARERQHEAPVHRVEVPQELGQRAPVVAERASGPSARDPG